MKFLRTLCLVNLVVLVSFNGTSPNQAYASPPADQLHADFLDRWAVVVGIDKFRDQSWRLKYAAKDANDFKNYLVENALFPSDHVRVLTGTDASKTNVSEAIDRWLPSVVKPQDLVVIFIRTRGTIPTSGTDLSYMATSDTNSDDLGNTAFEMTAFPRHILDKIHSAATILVVDADFSGRMIRTTGMNFPGGPSTDILKPDRPFQILCSAGKREISWESKIYQNSVFTRRLLEACRNQGSSVVFPDVVNSISDAVNDEVLASRNRSQHAEAIGMVSGRTPIGVLLAKPNPQKK